MHLNTKGLSILGVASGLGQKQKGVEAGPQFLRDRGVIDLLAQNIFPVQDLGDLKPDPNEDAVGWDIIRRLRERSFQALQNGDLLLTLGGDHSLAMGSVQGSLLMNPNTRLVWVDAHGDINTPQSSITGNLHGMPVAALLGLFKTPLGGPQINPQNILFIGVRDLDPAEKLFIEDLNITMITAQEIENAPQQMLQEIRLWLQKDSSNPIHLSFDIDALDPSVAPATGLRVPMGLSIDFAQSLVRLIADTRQLLSMDLVEINPLKALNANELNQTFECAIIIINAALSTMTLNQAEPISKPKESEL